MGKAILLASCFVACGGPEVCDPTLPETICTIVGNGEQGSPRDGAARETPLYVPVDVAVAPTGELWVPDFNNFIVRVVDADGDIRTVVGSGELGDSPPAGVDRVPALEASLNHNTNLVFRDGYVYIAAWHNSRIKRVRLSDMTLENFGGRGVRLEYDGDGGAARDAAFDLPAAMAFDPDGNLTFMDQGNQVIRQIDPAGVVRTIAGQCVVEDFEVPCAPGDPIVQCPGSNKVTCGDPADCQRPCMPAFGGDGGPALAARLAQPFGSVADPSGRMAYDRDGNLVFADTENHRIRKIDRAGIITTIAGTGGMPFQGGYAGDGGPAIEAVLNNPVDVAIADDGTIYFTDVFNSCIRSIDPSGTITRFAGQCGPEPDLRGFTGDGGSRLDARLDRPYGIELAGDLLYIADSYNNRIRVASTRSR
jgi:hypothetical protein